jgi:lactoylglutathione lyase/glyoxylase I family protein
MITRLAHLCLNVKNIARTIEFYNKKLGLPIQFQFEKNGQLFGTYFRAGELNFIEAFEKPDVEIKNTGLVHLCLESDDIDADIAAWTARGVACSPKKLGADHSWQTWIQDPDGNQLEIHQYTPESAQLQGGTVEVTW